jgi:hypothetical protein
MPSIRLRLPFYVLAFLVSHLWKKSLIVDIGKKVNKGLSFLTAFWHPHCSIIGVEAVPGGYQRYKQEEHVG